MSECPTTLVAVGQIDEQFSLQEALVTPYDDDDAPPAPEFDEETGRAPIDRDHALRAGASPSDQPVWLLGPQGTEPCRLEPGDYEAWQGVASYTVQRRLIGACAIEGIPMWWGSSPHQWFGVRSEHAPAGCHLDVATTISSNGEPVHTFESPAEALTHWNDDEPPAELAARISARECEDCRFGWRLRGNELSAGSVYELVADWISPGDPYADCEHETEGGAVAWAARQGADGPLSTLDFGYGRYFGVIHNRHRLVAVLDRTMTEITLRDPSSGDALSTVTAFIVDEDGPLPPRGMGPNCSD